jgi:uncharacterized membrane protein YeiH
MESAMSTPYFSIKRVASSKRSFLVVSGAVALIAFAALGVNVDSLIAYSPPTALVLFATGLGLLSLLGLRKKRRAS